MGDTASIQRLVEQAMRTFGRLEAAFNNATDGPFPSLAELDPEGFDRAIRTNVRGTFLGMEYDPGDAPLGRAAQS